MATRAEAQAIADKYGLKDPGNIDSVISGRASLEEYERDSKARAENYTGDRLYDSQGPEINNGNNEGGYSGDQRERALPDSRDDALSRVSAVYTGGTPNANPPQNNGTAELLSFLKEQQAGQQAQQAGVREILMSQLQGASKPVDQNDPNIRAQFVPQQQALQRSAERKRSQLAARLSSEGLADSGTFDTGLNAIEEQRGQGEASAIGGLLGQETSAKRSLLQNLLQMAISSGDAEAARTIQAQLQGLGMQQQDSQFGRSLGQQESQFGRTLGYNYAGLDQAGRQFNDQLGFNYDDLGARIGLGTAGLNTQALVALLNAL